VLDRGTLAGTLIGMPGDGQVERPGLHDHHWWHAWHGPDTTHSHIHTVQARHTATPAHTCRHATPRTHAHTCTQREQQRLLPGLSRTAVSSALASGWSGRSLRCVWRRRPHSHAQTCQTAPSQKYQTHTRTPLERPDPHGSVTTGVACPQCRQPPLVSSHALPTSGRTQYGDASTSSGSSTYQRLLSCACMHCSAPADRNSCRTPSIVTGSCPAAAHAQGTRGTWQSSHTQPPAAETCPSPIAQARSMYNQSSIPLHMAHRGARALHHFTTMPAGCQMHTATALLVLTSTSSAA
jgi:hypothetical protein